MTPTASKYVADVGWKQPRRDGYEEAVAVGGGGAERDQWFISADRWSRASQPMRWIGQPV